MGQDYAQTVQSNWRNCIGPFPIKVLSNVLKIFFRCRVTFLIDAFNQLQLILREAEIGHFQFHLIYLLLLNSAKQFKDPLFHFSS